MNPNSDTTSTITEADIDAAIASESYFTAHDGIIGVGASILLRRADDAAFQRITFCVLMLRNGHTLTGVNYGALDPAKHSAEDGRRYARGDARARVAELLAFLRRGSMDNWGVSHAQLHEQAEPGKNEARSTLVANAASCTDGASEAPKPAIIPPTIGRKVWYKPRYSDMPISWVSHDIAVPMDATITYVWNDRCVNLLIADHGGKLHALTSVHLVQPGDPLHDGPYAMWMPFQVGQAKQQQAEPLSDPVGDGGTPFGLVVTGQDFTVGDTGRVFTKTSNSRGSHPGAENARDPEGNPYSFGQQEPVNLVPATKPTPTLDQAIANDYGVEEPDNGAAPRAVSPLADAAADAHKARLQFDRAGERVSELETQLKMARTHYNECDDRLRKAGSRLLIVAGARTP